MIEIFARWVIRWRWLVILAAILLVGAAAGGGRYLEFSNDYRDFFSKKNPQLEAFESLQNIYTKSDNVLFVVAPRDGKVFTRETLATVEWLTREAWTLPYSSRVDSVTNFQHTRAQGDDLVVRSLVEDAGAFTDASLEEARRIALEEPLLLNRLISPRAHVTGVNVTTLLPGKSLDEVPRVAAEARLLVQRAEARDPNVKVYLTGNVLMDNAFGEYARKDLQTLTPLMYAAMIGVMVLLLRSAGGTLATVAVVLFAILTAMGLTGWLGIRLTAPSSAAPTIILTLAIADSIHILLSFFQARRRGLERNEAIVESLSLNMLPVFLTSLTTIIGFLTMNFSEVPPFRDLGNIVAIGVAAAWVYSILLLPALMAVLPMRVRAASNRMDRLMERVGDFVVRRRRPLLWGMTAVVLVLIAFIPRNELNDQFVEYFDESVDFRQATDFAVANLTGVYQIHYSLGAGESGGVSHPEYLAKLEAFAAWYRTQPGVIHVQTVTDVFKRLNKNMHGDDPAWYRIPEERNLAAQYLLLYELSLPFGLDLNDQINVDRSASRMAVTTENLTSKEILALEGRAQEWLRDHAPPSMAAVGTGPAVMFAYIGDRNIRSMILGNVIALILVSGILLTAMRSWSIGLISLVPNLVPAGMAFGLWGMFHGEVGLSLAVVTSMTFGIVVDDTIHFFTKYLHARRKMDLPPEEAVRYAFATVGSALAVTSIILVVGFSILTLSAFWLNAGMGLLSAMTVALALAADILLAPLLLMKVEGGRITRTAVGAAAVPMEEGGRS